jgi:hypothetical protein
MSAQRERGRSRKEKLREKCLRSSKGLCHSLTAAAGGLFLIGPMLIMSTKSSTRKSLVAVSAAMLVFIAVLTFGIRVSNIEVLVSTATHAAVLVVFFRSSAVGGGFRSQR